MQALLKMGPISALFNGIPPLPVKLEFSICAAFTTETTSIMEYLLSTKGLLRVPHMYHLGKPPVRRKLFRILFKREGGGGAGFNL